MECLLSQGTGTAVSVLVPPPKTLSREGAEDAGFVRKLFEKSFPTPFKNFHTFFLVCYGVSFLSRHRYCRLQSGTAKTLTALPWGRVFRGRNFSRKVPPPCPLFKSFHTFFLCHGVSIISGRRYCRMRRGIKHLCLIQQQRNVAIATHPKRSPERARRTRGRGFCGGNFLRRTTQRSVAMRSPTHASSIRVFSTPLSRVFKHFSLCYGVPIVSRHRCWLSI